MPIKENYFFEKFILRGLKNYKYSNILVFFIYKINKGNLLFDINFHDLYGKVVIHHEFFH